MEDSGFAIFYITHESIEKAKEFVSTGVKKGWIACGNIFPIQSYYMWQSNVVNDDEYVSIVKTGIHLIDKFTAYTEEVHPYDTPCIVHWTVKANGAYEQWIYDNVKPK
jgi:periplasmic divalent cation tolerance protein